MKTVIVGAGFGGMAAAALLARDGADVTVLEKNEQAGGRRFTATPGSPSTWGRRGTSCPTSSSGSLPSSTGRLPTSSN